MCGIFCVICEENGKGEDVEISSSLSPNLKRRGPDIWNHYSHIYEDVTMRSMRRRLDFFGFVLWLQGKSPESQPSINQDESKILLWNGDNFDRRELKKVEISDTQYLFKNLCRSSSSISCMEVISEIEGPYAFIYYDRNQHSLYFGRDFFGRQSLLIGRSSNNKIILTSVTSPGDDDDQKDISFVQEVPAVGFFRYNLKEPNDLTLIPWPYKKTEKFPEFLSGIPVKKVTTQLLKCPIKLEPLFLRKEPWISDEEVNNLSSSSYDDVLKMFISKFDDLIENLMNVLKDSVKVRALTQPMMCKSCVRRFFPKRVQCDHPKIGVLFSGGLDSVIITALLHHIFPSNETINLYNVAFDNHKSSEGKNMNIPDRQTGIQAVQELRNLYPTRNFDFIEIDISKEELIKMRESRIKHLLNPLKTVLDDSIGCAVWFAARGKLNGDETNGPRVLLLGMGADEQLGGYSRHRARYSKGGIDALMEELDSEILGISERNMGRDNRIISDHGVAPRLPFLDEKVVNFIRNKLEVDIKMDLRLGRGLGEKIILRACAYKLGLIKTALEPKRAIQFGSRIAKLENRKEKGHEEALR